MSAKDLGIHEGELLRPNKGTGIMWNFCPHMGEDLEAKHRRVLRKRWVGALEAEHSGFSRGHLCKAVAHPLGNKGPAAGA